VFNAVIPALSRRKDMNIIKFQEKYRQSFIDFNTDWIVSNFGFLEKEDIETFENIDKIIKNNGMIFFAVDEGIPLAACMTLPLKDNVWEICKLCSNKNIPHKGAGSAVFEASMNWALSRGAKKLFLISNLKLKAALHIYKKFGFKQLPLENYGYIRGNVACEYIVKDKVKL